MLVVVRTFSDNFFSFNISELRQLGFSVLVVDLLILPCPRTYSATTTLLVGHDKIVFCIYKFCLQMITLFLVHSWLTLWIFK